MRKPYRDINYCLGWYHKQPFLAQLFKLVFSALCVSSCCFKLSVGINTFLHFEHSMVTDGNGSCAAFIGEGKSFQYPFSVTSRKAHPDRLISDM